MAIKLQDKPNVEAPNATYPFGNIKDDTGSDDGTPLNQLVHADFHQFFAGLLEIGENWGMMTINGLPDNDVNGYQYQQAFNAATRLANRNLFKYLAETIIGTIIPSQPYALIGLESGVSPAIGYGYIYYAGDLYVCGGISPAITLTAQFNKTAEGVLTITDSATPGLFNYGDLIFVQKTTPKIVIHRTTSESATSATAILKFATAVSNIENWYNASTGKFTPQKAGFYQLNTKAMFSIGAALSGFEIELSVYKNGTLLEILHQEFDYTGSGNKANCQGDYIVSANGSTDYFEVRMALSTSQTWSMNGHVTWKFLPNC
jgi:hypothetical protein